MDPFFDRRDPRRDVSALLDRDHARLLELLADVQYLCAKGSFQPAAKVFAEFRKLQEQHLVREEALLVRMSQHPEFPPLLIMRAAGEHRTLRQRMESTWDAVCRSDATAFEREMAELSDAVDAHERAEKTDLLPALAAALSGQGAFEREVHLLVDRTQEAEP